MKSKRQKLTKNDIIAIEQAMLKGDYSLLAEALQEVLNLKEDPTTLRLIINANLVKIHCLNEALQIAKVALKKRNGTKRVMERIHKLENGIRELP